jgi:hypothetical protein
MTFVSRVLALLVLLAEFVSAFPSFREFFLGRLRSADEPLESNLLEEFELEELDHAELAFRDFFRSVCRFQNFIFPPQNAEQLRAIARVVGFLHDDGATIETFRLHDGNFVCDIKIMIQTEKPLEPRVH